MSKKNNDLVFQTIYNAAIQEGKQAAEKCNPTPMVVQQHASPFDDSSPVTKSWYVPQGVCGFAWVVIRPANCAFAHWLKKQGIGRTGYGGGWHIWVSDYGQSMELKEAYAHAFANYLHKVGIKACSNSRMD